MSNYVTRMDYRFNTTCFRSWKYQCGTPQKDYYEIHYLLNLGLTKLDLWLKYKTRRNSIGHALGYVFRALADQNEVNETSTVNNTWLATKVSN